MTADLRPVIWLAAWLLAGCSDTSGSVGRSAATSESSWCKQDYLSLSGRVVDQAEVLPLAVEAWLSGRLAEFEKRTGHQFVIATTTSLQGKPVEDYSLCLARHWAIGGKGKDDGVMLLVAPNERKARIEVGYGLERALRDDEAALIMRDTLVPAFNRGDYVGGVESGAEAIMREVS
jgi:uncharacterized protein